MNHFRLVNRWIKEGEGPTLDFKKTIKSAPKIAKTLVAFANGRGGKLVIGVTDEGRIKGTRVEQEKHILLEAAKQHCSPYIALEFQTLVVDLVNVLICRVKESNHKPHYAVDESGQKQLYVRLADQSIHANELVSSVLKSGDLNYVQRTAKLIELKDRLCHYIEEGKGAITIEDYMHWKSTSERSARRLLVDLVLGGDLQIENKAGIDFFSVSKNHQKQHIT